MAEEQERPGLAGQLADVRRIVEVGLTEIGGKLAVIALQLQQGEQRHDALAKTEAEHHRQVLEVLEEHDRRIQDGDKARAAEQAKAQAAAEGAKRFSTWVAIVVSVIGVVISVLLKAWGGGA